MYIFIVIIILVSILVLLFVFRKNNTISLAEAKKINETKHSKYFTFANQQFHYVEQGSGELVILIHGIGDSFYNYKDITPILAKKYLVVCIDLPAFGLSEVPNSITDENNVTTYYRSFIDAFLVHQNTNSLHLMGNSLGGLVAWDWAVNNTKFNLKSLSLLASAGFDMETIRKNVSRGILDKLPKFVLAKGAIKSISKLSADTCIVNKEKIKPEMLNAHYSMLNKEGTINFFIELLFNKYEPQIEKLANLDVPTLIIWGQKDKIIPVSHAYKFKSALKNGKVVLYDNVGHYPQIEKTEDLAADWFEFVNKI